MPRTTKIQFYNRFLFLSSLLFKFYTIKQILFFIIRPTSRYIQSNPIIIMYKFAIKFRDTNMFYNTHQFANQIKTETIITAIFPYKYYSANFIYLWQIFSLWDFIRAITCLLYTSRCV